MEYKWEHSSIIRYTTEDQSHRQRLVRLTFQCVPDVFLP